MTGIADEFPFCSRKWTIIYGECHRKMVGSEGILRAALPVSKGEQMVSPRL